MKNETNDLSIMYILWVLIHLQLEHNDELVFFTILLVATYIVRHVLGKLAKKNEQQLHK